MSWAAGGLQVGWCVFEWLVEYASSCALQRNLALSILLRIGHLSSMEPDMDSYFGLMICPVSEK